MPPLRVGRLTLGGRGLARLAAALAALAVLSGLWLGAATAAPLTERQPLHRVFSARLRGSDPTPELRGRRVLLGRYLRPTAAGAVVATLSGGIVEVRFTPQTRLPGRGVRPGDRVLVIGRPLPEGGFDARAVLLRRGVPAARGLLSLQGSGEAAGPARCELDHNAAATVALPCTT